MNFSTYDSSTIPNIKVGVLDIESLPEIDRDNPYLIVLRRFQLPGHHNRDITLMLYTRDIQPEVITAVEKQTGQVKVFPNPFTDEIVLDCDPSQSTIQFFDQIGNSVPFGISNQTISTKDWAPRVYYIGISGVGTPSALRVIKK